MKEKVRKGDKNDTKTTSKNRRQVKGDKKGTKMTTKKLTIEMHHKMSQETGKNK